MKNLAILFLLLTGCSTISTLPTDDVNNISPHQFTVHEWYGVSSGPNELPFIRGLNPTHITGGWKAFLNSPGWDDHLTISERSLKFKADGIVLHLPFGRNANEDFDFAGFTTSLKDPRLKNVTDISGFVTAWADYLKRTGYKKIFFYYGYVGADTAVWNGLTPDQTKKLISDNLTPLVFLQAAVKPMGISVGVFIDTLGQRLNPNDYNWTIAIPMIKSFGLMYGGEPWPNPIIPALKDLNYYTVSDMRSTWLFDPDFSSNGWNTWSAKQSDIKGPIMSFAMREWANNNYAETVEQFREKTIYSMKKYLQIAISPPDDPTQTAASLKKLASQNGTNCITQHEITRCCTSLGRNLTCTH